MNFFVIIALLISFFFPASAGDTLFMTSVSPDNAYVIRAYVGDGGGGATVANHVRCNLEDVREHSFRDIYYQYDQERVDIKWIDGRTVNISGKVLDVTRDSYDSRDEDDLEYWENYWEID